MAKHKIPEPKSAPSSKIKFSFEFYDTTSVSYCISKWGQDKIAKSLDRLKDINQKTFNELMRDKAVYHFSQVDWKQTTHKNGFSDDRINSLEPFHFALLGVNGQKARVFGAYADNVFYVVWFDLEHQIWPSFKKNT